MNWDNMLGNTLIALAIFVMFFGIRPFNGFQRARARTLDEFIGFVKKQSCQYVAVYTNEDLKIHTSDDGFVYFYVTARTMNRNGFVFSYTEKTEWTSTHSKDAAQAAARTKNALRARAMHETIRSAVTPSSKEMLITLDVRAA